jgi:hypothetical protein
MAICGDSFGGFPGELIGEEIFDGLLGRVDTLNDSMFSCNRI